jgi:exodeoxyribonuclease VII small subunit
MTAPESQPNADATVERPATDLGYGEAAAELDAIIGELDQGLIDVDRLEARFRRAIEIVEELDRRIRSARDRVDELMPRLDAVGGDGEPSGN